MYLGQFLLKHLDLVVQVFQDSLDTDIAESQLLSPMISVTPANSPSAFTPLAVLETLTPLAAPTSLALTIRRILLPRRCQASLTPFLPLPSLPLPI